MTAQIPTRVIVFMVALLAAACSSWVKITPEGEKVVALSAAEVENCRRVGHTTVSVLGKVAGLDRHPEDVQEELVLLARNSGAEIGGDAVVPESDVQNGKQKFGVYKCRR